MQMSNRQIKSTEFIVGIDQVVQLTTTDNSDSSDGDDPIDEEDIVFLEKAAVVANVMPRDRFFEIRTAWHFVENEYKR